MSRIKPDDIVVQNRIRKKFNEDHIERLACSLYTKGFIHPVTLKEGTTELLAGENRLRAYFLLAACGLHPRGCSDRHIPYTTAESLSPFLIREAELEENLFRENLTWQEETAALAELHEMKQEQHGPDWGFADTASLVKGDKKPAKGSQISKVSEAVVLAKHMDDPLIAHAKDKKTALKMLQEQNKQHKRAAAAASFDDFLTGAASEDSTSPDDPVAPVHTLMKGDFFDKASTLPDAFFDIVLTDPPYGIEIHRQSTFDTDKHEYDDSEETFLMIASKLAAESFRVTKDDAHCYIFCDIRKWPRLSNEFFLAGWTCWPRPLIWHKGNIGSFANADKGPRSTYEAILYAYKGKKEIQTHMMDVILVNQSTQAEHPANKPVPLLSNLLERSAFPGDQIIDFFIGAGPIIPAADEHKCVVTGIELNDKYYNMAVEKLLTSTQEK